MLLKLTLVTGRWLFADLEPGSDAGINAFYYESPGTAHVWQSWRRSLREYAQLLFQN